MENVLADMVQRLREIELLLRTQNELLTRVLTELEQIRQSPNADSPSSDKRETAPSEPGSSLHEEALLGSASRHA
jgi:hypothetical protein